MAGRGTVLRTMDSSQVFVGGFDLCLQWTLKSHSLTGSNDNPPAPLKELQLFSQMPLWLMSSASKTCIPVPASLLCFYECEMHLEYLVTTWGKQHYYPDTWSRQSLQNHFINHILEAVRKYILQATITMVSSGKWILHSCLNPQDPFFPNAMHVFTPRWNG